MSGTALQPQPTSVVFNALTRFLQCIPAGFPLKTRSAHVLLRSFEAQSSPILQAGGFRYAVPSLKEPVAFHLAIDGSYEPRLQALLQKTLQPGDRMVDVGANIGALTLPCAKRVGPRGTVLAIEASPGVFRFLEWNVRENKADNVELVNAAVQEEDGTQLSFWNAPDSHFGMGSLAPQFNQTPIVVPGIQLDTLLSARDGQIPRVIKMDVEGYEANVLKGASDTLSVRNAPMLVFEQCDWAEARNPKTFPGETQRILFDHGYAIWTLEDFPAPAKALNTPVLQGTHTLVAVK